jgi:hypothetical protein
LHPRPNIEFATIGPVYQTENSRGGVQPLCLLGYRPGFTGGRQRFQILAKFLSEFEAAGAARMFAAKSLQF